MKKLIIFIFILTFFSPVFAENIEANANNAIYYIQQAESKYEQIKNLLRSSEEIILGGNILLLLGKGQKLSEEKIPVASEFLNLRDSMNDYAFEITKAWNMYARGDYKGAIAASLSTKGKLEYNEA